MGEDRRLAVRRTRGTTSLTLALLLAACAALLLAPSSEAAWPGVNGKIVFLRQGQGQGPRYINPDGTGLSEAPSAGFWSTWSPDGRKLAYNCGGICTVNSDGTDRRTVWQGDFPFNTPGTQIMWSPDQTKFIYGVANCTYAYGCNSFYIVIRNQDGSIDRTIGGNWDDYYPAFSPDGTKIAFASTRDSANAGFCFQDGSAGCTWDIYVANADGSNQRQITNTPDWDETDPDWSPDGSKLVFSSNRDGFRSDIYTMNADGTNVTKLTNDRVSDEPAWSPDGTKIVFRTERDEPDPNNCSLSGDRICNLEIYSMNADGTGQTNVTNDPAPDGEPDWQPLSLGRGGYARPKGAGPVNVRFVPAFNPCAGSNPPGSVHGAPLAVPSCQPPQQSSVFLTMGTEDSNGKASQFDGLLQVKVVCNPPAPAATPPCTTTGDQADVRFEAQFTDVRNATSLTDYFGELEVKTTLRMTDRTNGLNGTDPATAVDVPFSFAVPCTGDLDTTIGSSCAVSTTADAVTPGIVPEGKRSVWGLGQVQVYDGGPDGVAATPDNTLFLTQGLFAP
jgi:Tol biopolymer transport system component